MDQLMWTLICILGGAFMFFLGCILGVSVTVKAIGPTPEAFEKKLSTLLSAAKKAEAIAIEVSNEARFSRATSLAAHMYVEALNRKLPGTSDALENLKHHVMKEQEFENGL